MSIQDSHRLSRSGWMALVGAVLLTSSVILVLLYFTVFPETPAPATPEPQSTAREPESVAPPSGYVHFLAQDAESARSFPLLFSFAEADFVEVPHQESMYYVDIVDTQRSYQPNYMQAPYEKLDEDQFGYPHADPPFLTVSDKPVDVPIINPQNTRRSEENSAYLFTGLGSEFVANTRYEELFTSTNYSNTQNWSIYLMPSTQASSSEIQELVAGAQPAWSPEEDIFYYLSDPGIRAYDLETQQERLLTQMFGRLPTTNSSLEISPDGTRLYVLSSVSALPNDRIFVYEIAQDDPFDLELLDTIDLPGAGGTHTDLTISPDGNYAGFMEYNEDEYTMYFKVIKLRAEAAVPETVFTWDNLSKKYYPHAEPRWIETAEFRN